MYLFEPVLLHPFDQGQSAAEERLALQQPAVSNILLQITRMKKFSCFLLIWSFVVVSNVVTKAWQQWQQLTDNWWWWFCPQIFFTEFELAVVATRHALYESCMYSARARPDNNSQARPVTHERALLVKPKLSVGSLKTARNLGVVDLVKSLKSTFQKIHKILSCMF